MVVSFKLLVFGALIAAAITLTAAPSYALSCMRPVLDEKAIDGAAVIFEGRVANSYRDLTKIAPHMLKEPHSTFEITKMWKGQGADTLKIFGDPTWGPFFSEGKGEHLIIAGERDGKLYSPLCGNSTMMSNAGDKLEILKLRFPDRHDKNPSQDHDNISIENKTQNFNLNH